MEGWVKLHKRLRDHELLRDDMAFKLFTILLLYVNTQTGKYTAGRYQLSEMTGIKPITVYKALKRLEKKWKMVTLVSNNQFTEITVSNWGKYQSRDEVGNSDGNNTVTPREQRGNTNKEIRYKKKENTNTSEPKVSQGVVQVLEIFKAHSPSLSYGNTTQRKAAEEMIAKYGLQELLGMCKVVIAVQGLPYAPRASTPYAMWQKIGDFKSYFEAEKAKQEKSKPTFTKIS